MVKVAVVGAAGGIGQPLSLLLKLDNDVTELHLIDVVPLVKGVAADLSHIRSPAKVSAFTALEEGLKGVELVLIPAGVPRKPGMTRDDLFNINAGIVRGVAEACAKSCPEAFFGVISNPVNSTVPIFAEAYKKVTGKFPFSKLFGVSTLDILRADTFVAEAVGVTPKYVSVPVIGGHAGETILPVLSQCGYALTEEQVNKLTPRIQDAGTEVVEAKGGAGSATLSMAVAAHEFAKHFIVAMKGGASVFCSYVHDEHYSNQGVSYFAQKVLVTEHGIKARLGTGPLSEAEKARLAIALKQLAPTIKKGIEFVHNPPKAKL